jgi:low affinity Fe/Cu permease
VFEDEGPRVSNGNDQVAPRDPAVSVRRVAARAPEVVGSPWMFMTALCATIIWLVVGSLESFSGRWVLWPATATSVGAFLLVLLLQYSQNRDTRALQLKLDELIRSTEQARAELLRLEDMPDEHLADLEAEFRQLRAEDRGRNRDAPASPDDPSGGRARDQ